MSVSSNAERLMGRISAGRAQSAALSEVADEADYSPKVCILTPHSLLTYTALHEDNLLPQHTTTCGVTYVSIPERAAVPRS